MNGLWPSVRRWGWLLATCSGMAWSSAAHPQPCNPVVIGVGLAQADSGVVAWGCRGWGQVFLARDTLIHSISIWRPAKPDSDAQPRYLFITDADSVGPRTNRLLLTAPPIVHQVGDGIHPVEYRWVFDPPFALPRKGLFFFDIQADRWSVFVIPASSMAKNPYPDGGAWKTSTVGGDCPYPGAAFNDPPPRPDLAFEVQFCGAGPVGVPPPGARPLSLSAAPNPFQRTLQVSFDLPSSTYVRLAVFDLTGRRVATLVDGVLDPGPHSATWGWPSAIGGRAGTGMYFIRLEAGGQRLSRTVVHVE
jgi:hypothetical protein